jgi:hypothetical protein
MFLASFSFSPPYMLICFQTLLTKGSAGESLLNKPCRGKTFSSTRLDRQREIVLPLAAFLGQSMIGGTCFEHLLYKDPTPQELREIWTHEYVVCWIGQTPIMT